jgi:hypothetical protein
MLLSSYCNHITTVSKTQSWHSWSLSFLVVTLHALPTQSWHSWLHRAGIHSRFSSHNHLAPPHRAGIHGCFSPHNTFSVSTPQRWHSWSLAFLVVTLQAPQARARFHCFSPMVPSITFPLYKSEMVVNFFSTLSNYGFIDLCWYFRSQAAQSTAELVFTAALIFYPA